MRATAIGSSTKTSFYHKNQHVCRRMRRMSRMGKTIVDQKAMREMIMKMKVCINS